jgi:hypothetical protein
MGRDGGVGQEMAEMSWGVVGDSDLLDLAIVVERF